jgi:hypothetical protein
METGAAFVAPDRPAGGNQYATIELRTLKGVAACADCGETHPWWVMDVDHIDGTTTRERAREAAREGDGTGGRGGTATASRALRDIRAGRAEIVCANCHKDRTHQRRERKEA